MTSRVRQTRLVVLDEHPMVSEWIAHKLRGEADLELCGQAESVAEAVEMIERREPDLAIVELSLTDVRGMEVIRALKQRFANLPVLVFSAHSEEMCAEAALQAGALGFLSKRESGRALKLAIRRVLSGEVYLSDRIAACVLRALRHGKPPAQRSPRALLSARELQLFALVGEGYKPAEIALKLKVSVKTIESYSARVREKLGLANARELFRRAVAWLRVGDE